MNTEEKDERPSCDKLIVKDNVGRCGSERGLKRIKYSQPSGWNDMIVCDKHLSEEWGHKDAESAEPVHREKKV